MSRKLQSVAVAAFVLYSLCISISYADALSDRIAFWEASAFSCTNNGLKFPSKQRADSTCDDGDMTLFNGLLCASGDMRGCNAVRDAQGADGRWWRSPDRIGKDSSAGYDVSFSPDQALGALLYVIKTNDAGAFRRWMVWIDDHRPCVLEVFGRCVQRGWPRFCTDDPDKRCTLRPGNCLDLEEVGRKLGVTEGSICQKVLAEFKISSDIFDSTDDRALRITQERLALGAAAVNDLGFPLHLAGVELFVLKQLGRSSLAISVATSVLIQREPKNPFFQFLDQGKTPAVLQLALDLCPSSANPSLSKTQWAWERASADQAWLNSMYWDCIFMSNLLK